MNEMDKDNDNRRSKRSRSEDSCEGHRDRDEDRHGHRDRDEDEDRHGRRDRHSEGHRSRDRGGDRYSYREGHRRLDSDRDLHRDRNDGREGHRRREGYDDRDGKRLYRGDDGRRYQDYDHRYDDHPLRDKIHLSSKYRYDEEWQNRDRKPEVAKREEVKGGGDPLLENALSTPSQPKSPVPIKSVEEPSCLVLGNVFEKTVQNNREYYLDIEDWIQERCAQFGPIEHIRTRQDHGVVYMRFGTPRIAALAQEALHGSELAGTGRVMTATFMPDKLYLAKFPTK